MIKSLISVIRDYFSHCSVSSQADYFDEYMRVQINTLERQEIVIAKRAGRPEKNIILKYEIIRKTFCV